MFDFDFDTLPQGFEELIAEARSRRLALRQQQGDFSAAVPTGWRLYAVSDLHTDYKENRQWVEGLPLIGHEGDVVILAGDVSHRADSIRSILKEFLRRFAHVFYCVGNHELWVKRDDASSEGNAKFIDSSAKFEHLLATCRELGVHTEPTRVGAGEAALWILPLQSWYEADFGKPGEELKKQASQAMTDNHQCVWPGSVGSTHDHIAQYFDRMNVRPPEPNGFDAPVVTFSHFLPRLELLPAQLPKQIELLRAACGSKLLEVRLREACSKLHVFGHSHVNWYTHWDGVHYIQNALRYPQERKQYKTRVDATFDALEDAMAPFLVWDSANPRLFCLQPERCGRGCPHALATSQFIANKDSQVAAKTWAGLK